MPFYSQAHLAVKRGGIERNHLSLGWHPLYGDEFFVSETNRRTATYIVGTTGYGKSGLLRTMVHRDARAGNAIIVFDPNHDLTMDILAELPVECLDRTYLLSMKDEDFPFGCNPLAVGKLRDSTARTQAIQRLVNMFDLLFPEAIKQQNLPMYLQTAAVAMVHNPGHTLLHIVQFLTDKIFRDSLLQKVTDPMVHAHWRDHDSLSPSDQETRVRPLVNRLRSLFMGHELVRNIACQSYNSVGFRRAIEDHEIILIDLPLRDLGEDARLVGTMLLSQVYSAIFSFADLPEHQRPGVSIYIDEFAAFTLPSFSRLFAEGRKFGLRLTVVNQHRSQLPKFLRDDTESTGVKICFRLNADDAKDMAAYFPDTEATIKPEDIDPHVTETLLIRASDYGPNVERFVDCFLQPLQQYRRGRGRVEIVNHGADWRKVLVDMQTKDEKPQNLMVDDPTYFLDRLLYDVMRTGNWRLPIPYEIPRGFANAGVGFFAAARGAKDRDLGPEFIDHPPLHLIRLTADGDMEWDHEPRDGRETFYFFLFCLRSLMHQLTEAPIGKESTSSSSDTARMLTQLPMRQAFVRAGDDVGTIFTHDTPPHAADEAQRYLIVLNQTRAKYCHPREDVERAILDDTPVPEPQVVAQTTSAEGIPSGWERI